MVLLDDALTDFAGRFGTRLPEHRPVELFSRKRRLPVAPADPAPMVDSLSLAAAYALLEAIYDRQDPHFDGKSSWQKYLGFAALSGPARIAAEIFRILRVAHLATVTSSGYVEERDGMIKIGSLHQDNSVSMVITGAGLDLLVSAVAWYADAGRQPYGEAYVEAMLTAYYADISAEIGWYNDENKVPYQFRRKLDFNRHLRLDCDNPRYRETEEGYLFEINAFRADPWRYPIDFYLMVDDRLHIIPVEALTAGLLPVADLVLWQARSGGALPAHFRFRFGHDIEVPT